MGDRINDESDGVVFKTAMGSTSIIMIKQKKLRDSVKLFEVINLMQRYMMFNQRLNNFR